MSPASCLVSPAADHHTPASKASANLSSAIASTRLQVLVWLDHLNPESKAIMSAGLYLVNPDTSQHGTLVRAIKAGAESHVEAFRNFNPLPSSIRGWSADIAVLPQEHDTVINVMSRIPFEDDGEWDGQHWVGAALRRMVELKLITDKERELGLDKMVDFLIEAVDMIH
ncbi:hypothetical protein FQN57_000934 [Myotisia sp. PD_48]|nr:hypothetical protein FQN57_000934 [Myotisia sp. PD_48]